MAANAGHVVSVISVVIVAFVSLSAFYSFASMSFNGDAPSTGQITSFNYKTSGNSCKGYCGQRAPGGCFCEPSCVKYGDCCIDYKIYCQSYTPSSTTTTTKTTARTTTTRFSISKTTTTSYSSGPYCAGRCGTYALKYYNGKKCYCDSTCISKGDCCPDACQYCSSCATTTTYSTTTTFWQSCYDSDSSVQAQYSLSVKGQCRDFTGTKEDYCSDSGTVAELSCISYGTMGLCAYANYPCDLYGLGQCSNGACAVQTATTTTIQSHVPETTTTVQGSDPDGDGIPSGSDNCPLDYNPSQRDVDSNGVGDLCEGKYFIRIKAHLHYSLDKNQYLKFISDIENYYNSHGLQARLIVTSVDSYYTNCPSDEAAPDADVVMCMGPGQGGYMGPPYYWLGANSNAPFGFTSTGIHSEAHEILHFLGVADTYYMPSDMPKPQWFVTDIMNDPYNANPTISDTELDIARSNIRQISALGREYIYYPRREPVHPSYVRIRMPDNASLEIKAAAPGTSCSAWEIYIFAQTEAGKLLSIGSFYSDSISRITIPVSSLKYYYGLKLSCSGSIFWIPSKIFDDCFIKNGYKELSKCSISCKTPGSWCEAS